MAASWRAPNSPTSRTGRPLPGNQLSYTAENTGAVIPTRHLVIRDEVRQPAWL